MGDKMDMALDDIIKTTKGSGRGGRGGRGRGSGSTGGGGAAAGGRGRGGRGTRGGFASGGFNSRNSMSNGGGRSGGMTTGRWNHDMFQGAPGMGRMGPQPAGPVKINISNLDYGVTDSDIRELFQEFGDMRSATVHYDRSGCSVGVAQVLFGRIGDAQKALRQYNGVHLDGRPMKIFMEGDSRGGAMGAGGRPLVKRLNQGGPTRGGGGGRGARGGAGGRGRGGRSSGDAGEKKPKTAEELDAELDTYIATKDKK